MKKYFTLFLIVYTISAQAQVTTYFYGRDKVQSNGETAALYSVAIYENSTRVTIELIPTRNRFRMNYWSSRNTYIKVGQNIKLPIVGFLRNGEVHTDPFSGDWGWSNVKKGEKYYYTMVFAGKIPPGVTNFTLEDEGVRQYNDWSYHTAHGYGFRGYTLNNPRQGTTSFSETTVKQNIDTNNDGMCGIYEGADEQGYKLGCIKINGEYQLIYLGSKQRMSWWQVGDKKAVLRESATKGFFKASWYMANKTLNTDSYVVFDGGSMKTIVDGEETFYLKMYPSSNSNGNIGSSSKSQSWSGTGFALMKDYIVTNYHVVEDAKSIYIQGVNGDFNKKHSASVIATDKVNDLALLKFDTPQNITNIPYTVKTYTSEVGEDIWVLGYPLTSTMGDEIKLTNGIISAKSGFEGDVAMYQISAPVQPGNSGGPVFDSKGNLIGIVCAHHRGAENVSYAIKTTYLRNLIESTLSNTIFPQTNRLSQSNLAGKVKLTKDYVYYIICSSEDSNITSTDTKSGSSINNGNIVSYPFTEQAMDNRARITQVELSSTETKVTIYSYNTEGTTYYEWCNINKNTSIKCNGQTYYLTRAEGIAIAPDKTYYGGPNKSLTFTLIFPAIPTDTQSFDLIESDDSTWKWYGIQLKR